MGASEMIEVETALEAKLVVLGASGVGKTSLLTRYIHNTFPPPKGAYPTVGAAFVGQKVPVPDAYPPATLRLQVWDTAGQERFRSISRLYYRGAHAALLCYDVTDERSFLDLQTWVSELRQHAAEDCVVHVVGTKADVVAEDPSAREVSFDQCIRYLADELYAPGSGFWGAKENAVESCHEVSAKDGEGVEEVFRMLVRTLVEQRRAHADGTALPPVLKTESAPAAWGSGWEEADGDGSREAGRDRTVKIGPLGLSGLGDKTRSWLVSAAEVVTPHSEHPKISLKAPPTSRGCC